MEFSIAFRFHIYAPDLYTLGPEICRTYMQLSCFDSGKVLRESIVQQDPVVQSIFSLTISLRHKFVKQISAKVTKNNSVFVILMFEILTKR